MASLSDYLEDELVDHSLGTGAFTSPSAIYLALFTSDPTDAGTGTEVSGFGYARQTVAFGASSGGVATNSSVETFTASGGDFGTITHFAIYDGLTGGNLLFHAAMTASKTVANGESITFAAGSITVTFA